MAQIFTRTACDWPGINVDTAFDRAYLQVIQRKTCDCFLVRRATLRRHSPLRESRRLGANFPSRTLLMCQAQTTAVLFSGQERHYRGDEETVGTVGILDRLLLAWRVLFPDRKASPRQIGSNALVAKERLRMILISDRCSVNDLAKKKIMDNIVGALADFVVIESEEKIQLNVSLDPDLGAVYAVTVPIRRVKPEYQSHSKQLQDVDLHEAIVDESERPFQSVGTLNSQSV